MTAMIYNKAGQTVDRITVERREGESLRELLKRTGKVAMREQRIKRPNKWYKLEMSLSYGDPL